jgi:ribosome-associated translation inhibitor RaiA
MALTVRLEWRNVEHTPAEEEKINQKLRGLERRLVHHPTPLATITITGHQAQRTFDVAMNVQLGPLGPSLISHQTGDTIDAAVGKAIRDVERQLERHHGKQRGESSFGTPSRRRPYKVGEEPTEESETAEEKPA